MTNTLDQCNSAYVLHVGAWWWLGGLPWVDLDCGISIPKRREKRRNLNNLHVASWDISAMGARISIQFVHVHFVQLYQDWFRDCIKKKKRKQNSHGAQKRTLLSN